MLEGTGELLNKLTYNLLRPVVAQGYKGEEVLGSISTPGNDGKYLKFHGIHFISNFGLMSKQSTSFRSVIQHEKPSELSFLCLSCYKQDTT